MCITRPHLYDGLHMYMLITAIYKNSPPIQCCTTKNRFTRASTRQALTWCCFVMLLQQKPVGNAAKPRPSCSSRSSIPAGVEGGSTSGKPPPTSRGFFGPITDDDSTTQQQYSLSPSLPSAEGTLCGRLLWQFSLDVGRCAGRVRPYLES